MSRAALDDVVAWYRHARALWGCTHKLLANDPDAFAGFSPSVDWHGSDKVETYQRRTLRELDDYTVLALFSTFEGWLREDFERRCQELRSGKEEFGMRVIERGELELKKGRLEGLLDVYKAFVCADVVGRVKQVQEYRNWVAHGRGEPPPPANIWPGAAHARLTGFITCTQEGC